MEPLTYDAIKMLGACPPALDWLINQESFTEAWHNCKRADWLAWYLGAKEPSLQKLVLTLYECIQTMKLCPQAMYRLGIVMLWLSGDLEIKDETLYYPHGTYCYENKEDILATYELIRLTVASNRPLTAALVVRRIVERGYSKAQRDCLAIIWRRYPVPPSIGDK